jgi:hypothetical protein
MKIVTSVVNNTDFIEIQYYTLKKYCKGEFEFIVFNDAKEFPDFTNEGDVSIKSEIEKICRQLNVLCINVPNDHHREMQCAAARCADAMNFILNYQKQNPDKYLILDSDMFVINEFDVEKYNDYNCAIVLQQRGNIFYFWNGIYYFDFGKMSEIELLNWNPTPNCDVGGMMQEWLRKQLKDTNFPDTITIRNTNTTYVINQIYLIRHLWSSTWNEDECPEKLKNNSKLIEFLKNDPRNENNNFFCELYDNTFLHYRAGGNWRREGMEFHKTHTKKLKDVLLCTK